MIHQILVNDRFWAAQPGVLCQRYEDLIADPVAGVERLAAYLGLTLAPGEAAEVAGEYSFQANRQRTLTMGHRLREEGIDLNDPSNVQYYDRLTLLHWNHMRDGRAGNWRDLATPRERAVLARLCDAWLARHEYSTDTRVNGAGVESHSLVPAIGESVRMELGLARSWLTCALRCASLRHPRVARLVKRCLGMKDDRVPARPIAATTPSSSPTPSPVRFDPGVANGSNTVTTAKSSPQRAQRSPR
jgi:hypothetical protein